MDKRYVELLTFIQGFETYWAYYSQSDGRVYGEHCRYLGKQLANRLRTLAREDPKLLDAVRLGLGEKTDPHEPIARLAQWSGNPELKSPYDTIAHGRFIFFPFFTELKFYILKKLGCDGPEKDILSSEEWHHMENALRWQPHLPNANYLNAFKDLDHTISRLSASDSVIVYGDIRRSQDLMLYTVEGTTFAERLLKFFTTVRSLFEKHLGILDKFTGDGFLGYFNDYLSKSGMKDYIESFLSFTQDCMSFATVHFKEWERYVRKIPEGGFMLALGADLGKISFKDFDGHLICTGDSLVWAERMCSRAGTGEIVVNNLLAHRLSNRSGVRLEETLGKTKTGESFQASFLKFEQK